MPWGELRAHVLHRCVKSKFSCPHDGCGQAVFRNDLDAHVAACEHGTTMCECGEEVVRRLLSSHRATTCPTQKVACEYCGLLIERGKIHGHHRGGCRGWAPVSLLFEICDKLEARCQALENNLSMLTSRPERGGGAFRLDLPTAIQDLPVNDSGLFQRGFGDVWQLLVRPPTAPHTPWFWVGLKHAGYVVKLRLVVIRLEDVSHHFRRTWAGPTCEIGRDFLREDDFAPELASTVWIQIFRESYETVQLS